VERANISGVGWSLKFKIKGAGVPIFINGTIIAGANYPLMMQPDLRKISMIYYRC
jgi:hypothetical protein